MDKFKNKYRGQSHRMPGWDYSGNGFYFITIVTTNRECNLGKITDGKMVLSDWGKIVENEFLKSFEIRNELFLDEYIIMPNHLHAIVVLNKNKTVDHNKSNIDDSHDLRNVGTHGRASLRSVQQPNQQSDRPTKQLTRLPKSISSFLAGFKSAINTKIDDYIDEHKMNIPKYNHNNHFFQPNYYDHIIRNKNDYWRIKNYIKQNPANWNDDKFN